MIKRLSASLSQAWGASGAVKSEDVELYQYGLELLLSTVVNVVLIALVSAAAGRPAAFVTYLLAFVPLRSFAGGYHAKAHWSCILITVGSYAFFLLLALRISGWASILLCVGTGAISFLLLLLLAPVPAGNKPLTEWEVKRNRIISLAFGGVLLVLGIVFSLCGLASRMAVKMLFTGEIMAMVLLTVGYVNAKRCST